MAVVQSIVHAGAVCPSWPRTHAPALYSLERLHVSSNISLVEKQARVITMRVACTCESVPWDVSGELAP